MSGRHTESFFVRSQPRSSVRARSFFGLPGRIRSAAGRAEIFFWPVRSLFTQLCQPVKLFLLGRLRAEMSARAAKNFFCYPVASSLRNKLLFFGCPVASAQQSARAEFFFPRSFFFCHPVSSAQNLFDFFLWRMESLQYTFLESCVRNLNCLAFSLCHFWLSDHTGQKQLNWPMGAVEPVLRTSSTAYIYLTLPFSSLTPTTLALVSSQHLEPSLSLTSTGSQFQNLFNHGASSQPFRD